MKAHKWTIMFSIPSHRCHASMFLRRYFSGKAFPRFCWIAAASVGIGAIIARDRSSIVGALLADSWLYYYTVQYDSIKSSTVQYQTVQYWSGLNILLPSYSTTFPLLFKLVWAIYQHHCLQWGELAIVIQCIYQVYYGEFVGYNKVYVGYYEVYVGYYEVYIDTMRCM